MSLLYYCKLFAVLNNLSTFCTRFRSVVNIFFLIFQLQSPVPASPITTIKMEKLASNNSSQSFDDNDEAISQVGLVKIISCDVYIVYMSLYLQSQVPTQELILPAQFIKMENNSEEDSMNEVLPREGSAETPQV